MFKFISSILVTGLTGLICSTARAESIDETLARYSEHRPLSSVIDGKITFNFYGHKRCPLTKDLMRLTTQTIAEVDQVIGPKAIHHLEIDEWCSPGATGTDRMNLGVDRDLWGSKAKSIIVHEYGHLYLRNKYHIPEEPIHKKFDELRSKLSDLRLQLTVDPSNQTLQNQYEGTFLQFEIVAGLKFYLESLQEYFADMFAILILETNVVVNRNHQNVPIRWFWSESRFLRVEDPHFGLEGIWEQTYQLAQKCFGHRAKKLDLLNRLVNVIKSEIEGNLQSYNKKFLDIDEVASRMEESLLKELELADPLKTCQNR